jgi:urea carboxylase
MRYEPPIHRPLGDLALGIEVGDELSLELSFLVLALHSRLLADPPPGVTEMVPTHRTLAVFFDPLAIELETLSAAVREHEDGLEPPQELPSRLVEIPIWYGDPWSRECAEAYGVRENLGYLAEINDTTVEGVVRWHTGREHWVSAVGFQPSTYQALPLDLSDEISAPKYPRPRASTPGRIVCLAGQLTSFYPFESPGGYQLLGRTPLELYDPRQRLPDFADGPVLPKVGDRHRYVAIGEEEYRDIRAQVEDGTYAYRIEDGVCRRPDREAAT